MPFNNIDFEKYTTFICPKCGKKVLIKDARIIPIQTKSEHVDTKIKGRMVQRTYRDTFHAIRFCNECAKKKHKYSKIGLLIMFCFIPLSISIWVWTLPERGFGSFIGSLIFCEFICFLLYGFFSYLTEGSEVDLEHASKCNAIAERIGDKFF